MAISGVNDRKVDWTALECVAAKPKYAVIGNTVSLLKRLLLQQD